MFCKKEKRYTHKVWLTPSVKAFKKCRENATEEIHLQLLLHLPNVNKCSTTLQQRWSSKSLKKRESISKCERELSPYFLSMPVCHWHIWSRNDTSFQATPFGCNGSTITHRRMSPLSIRLSCTLHYLTLLSAELLWEDLVKKPPAMTVWWCEFKTGELGTRGGGTGWAPVPVLGKCLPVRPLFLL